jgi:hypothetical protein
MRRAIGVLEHRLYVVLFQIRLVSEIPYFAFRKQFLRGLLYRDGHHSDWGAIPGKRIDAKSQGKNLGS